MEIRNWAAAVCICLGIFFAVISVIGTFKQRDFLNYLQVAGIGSGAGIILCCGGLFIYEGLSFTSLKLVLVALLLLITSPVGTHAIAKASFKQMQEEMKKTTEEEANVDSNM